MNGFAQIVQGWQTFYATIAASSATLLGLLFVALSLKLETVNLAQNSGMRLLARQAFTTFLSIIAIGLTFLIPGQVPLGLGMPLICIALSGLIVTLRESRTARAIVPPGRYGNLLRHSGLKIVAFVSLLLIAVGMLTGAAGVIFYLMLAPVLFLLFSASRDTWSILVGGGEASKRR